MKKIIVADDDLTSRSILVNVARSEGHMTIETSSGARAWDLLSDNSDIDCLITDMMMPELSGRELIMLIRGTEHYKRLPIILVSAVVTLNEISDILERGASRFLAKPVNTAHLREYLNALIGEKH
ncbi:MAG: response regulator [Bdellovibrionota bacterium]